MQAVENEVETVHLYVVREHEKKPYTLLPLLCALFCLAGIAALTLYSAEHPYYEYERLTVPARLLPPQMFHHVDHGDLGAVENTVSADHRID